LCPGQQESYNKVDVISKAEFDSMRVSDEQEEDGDLLFGMDQEDASVPAAAKRPESSLVHDSRTRARDGKDKRDVKSSPSPSAKRYQQRKHKRKAERQERFYPVLKESSSSMVRMWTCLSRHN